MRAVITRVREASVTIEGRVNGAIGQGFLVLLGVGPNDTEAVCDKLAEKICNLRVFEDENGRMNRSLEQVGGAILVVSQFTLRGHLLPPPGLTGAASWIWPSPSTSASDPLPGPGLRGPARGVRRGHAGRLRQRRARHHPAGYRRQALKSRGDPPKCEDS